MMAVVFDRATTRVTRLRSLILIGTALGGSLAAPVSAERIVFNGTGDFNVSRTEALTDAANVVDARTTVGNLVIGVGGINASNNSGTLGAGIFGQVTGAGTLRITSVTLTASGNTAIYGVDARAVVAPITINAGTTTATNASASRGINAMTSTGNVAITAGITRGTSNAIFVDSASSAANLVSIVSSDATATGGAPEGLFAPIAISAVGGSVSIDSSFATVAQTPLGGGAISAIARNGNATVKSGVAAASSAGGTLINVSATGNASIDSTIAAASINGSGLSATSSGGGAVSITSGTYRLTSTGTLSTDTVGLRAQTTGSGTISVNSGTIAFSTTSGGTGITTDASAGATDIASMSVVSGAGIRGRSTTGAIRVRSGAAVGSGASITSTTTTTIPFSADPCAGASCIFPGTFTTTTTTILNTIDLRSTSGAITLDAGTTTAAGASQSAIVALSNGNITVTSGTATSASQHAIFAGANSGSSLNLFPTALGTGTTTVKSTSATTNAVNGFAIVAQGGTVLVDSGTATQSTGASFGSGGVIFANAGVGGATVKSATAMTNGNNGRVIELISQGVASVDSGSITTIAGPNGSGIGGISVSASGATVIKSSTISLAGSGTGISASSGGGSLTINSSEISAAAGAGISVSSSGGSATIASGTITARSGGISADAFSSIRPSGDVNISSDQIRLNFGNAIFASGNTINIASNSISGGQIFASGRDVTVSSGSMVDGGITVRATGRVTLASSTMSGSSEGISVSNFGSAATVVTSDSVTNSNAFRGGINVSSSSGSTTINSNVVRITGQSATGIRVSGAGAATINSGDVSILGASGTGISVNSNSAVTIKSTNILGSNSASTARHTGIGVSAGGSGATAIDSGAITLGGGTGISVAAGSGATSIKSAAIATKGDGISVAAAFGSPTTGAIVIDSGTISSGLTAINVSGGAATVTSAAITGTGHGISVNGSGNVSIDSGSITMTSVATPSPNTGTLNSLNGSGIVGSTNGTSNLTIESGSILYTGTGNTLGITAVNSGSGTLDIASGTISVVGNGGYGILASANSGAMTVTSTGDITTRGTTRAAGGSTARSSQRFADGIDALSLSGAITVSSAGTISTAGAAARGINVEAGRAITTLFATIPTTASTAAISVTNGGTVTTAGANATAIHINADNNTVNLVSNVAATSGANSVGIVVRSGAPVPNANRRTGGDGSISIDSRQVATSGAESDGILAIVDGSGGVTVTSGTVTTTGAGARGIAVNTSVGNIVINSTSASTSGGRGDFASEFNGGVPDAIFAYARSAGSVTITSGTASSAADGASAVEAIGGGRVSITSGTASTSGADSSTLYAQGDQAESVSINATMTSATGANSRAIEGIATGGALTIVSGTATARDESAIGARAGTTANVTAANTSAAGLNSSAVRVEAQTGIVLNIGSATTSGPGFVNPEVRAATIRAEVASGAITANIGSATATGQNMNAVVLLSNGASGSVTASISGNVASNTATGLLVGPPLRLGGTGIIQSGTSTVPGNLVAPVDLVTGFDVPRAVLVNIGANGSVSGALAGINTAATINDIRNFGTIFSSTGPAIIASGVTALDNSGTITGGAGGVAVQLGATNDTVILRTGSVVTGAIVAGGGADRVVLAGTSNSATPTQTLARFTDFDSVIVTSGYWTTSNTTSAFKGVTINPGATLEIANGAIGIFGTVVRGITTNGTLVVRSSSASAGSTFGPTTVLGIGNVLLTGPGTVLIDGVNTIRTGTTVPNPDPFAGAAPGPATIFRPSGTLTVDGGTTLILTGTQGGSLATTATGTFQLGSGGTTGTFSGSLANDGIFNFNRSDSVTLSGAVTGGGTIIKNGAGTLTFGTSYAFTGTTMINAGSIRLSTPVAPTTELDVRGSGTLDLSGTQQVVAELAGTSGTASVNIAGGSLTVNQGSISSFAGNLQGAGSLTKTGAGTLNITGTNSYTGPTTVSGGRLAVNGSILSPTTVASGGTLGGTGTVSSVTIASGGIFAPGNSVGTISVAGPLTFATGSTFQVEANNAAADRIVATGAATLSGGTVAVIPDLALGAFGKVTTYNIITASAVTGTFGSVTSANAALLPLLSYTATGVNLTLARPELSFGAIATNANQLAVANAAQARGFGNAVFNAVLIQPTTAAGQAAFDALSGEVHASVPTLLMDEGRRVRGALLDRAGVGGDGASIWATGLANNAETSARAGVAATATDRTGAISGIDYGFSGWRVGAAVGYANSDLAIGDRASTADTDTTYAAIYGGTKLGRLSVRIGLSYAWHEVETARTLSLAGLGGAQTGRHDATSWQLAEEIAYAVVDTESFRFEPFVGIAAVTNKTDALVEGGGAAALGIAAAKRQASFATVGLRASGTARVSATVSMQPHMRLTQTWGWGRTGGSARVNFAGGAAFGISGANLGRDTFNAEGGLDFVIGNRLRIGAAAYGSSDVDLDDYGAKLSLGLSF